MNTAILPQQKQPSNGRRRITDEEYAIFLAKLRNKLADGQWHSISAQVFCKENRVSRYTFAWLKNRGCIEKNKETGQWRRLKPLNELTPSKLREYVTTFATAEIRRCNKAKQQTDTIISTTSAEKPKVANLADLRKQGFGMGEVAKLVNTSINSEDFIRPDLNQIPLGGMSKTKLATTLAVKADTSPVVVVNTHEREWDLPQEHTELENPYTKLFGIATDDSQSEQAAPAAGLRKAIIRYQEDDDNTELVIKIELSGYLIFDLDHVQNQMKLATNRILELVEADIAIEDEKQEASI